MFSSLLRLWAGPLPHQELFPKRMVNPLAHWIFHPAKRWTAKLYILFLQKYVGLRVISVTGSIGKTSTKDMLYSILIKISPAVVTSDTGNPTYSIPAAILHCRPSTRFLILDMGVAYPGDMLFYTWLVRPDIGILTGTGLTHTGSFGARERLTAEQIGIITGSVRAICTADDPLIRLSFPAFKFGRASDNFTRIISAVITPRLTTHIELTVSDHHLAADLPAIGTHLAVPAAAAATAAFLVDVHPQIISHGLETYTPAPHCLALATASSGALVLDDTASANPTAVLAALDVLLHVSRSTGTTPVFVFGQMNELGQYEIPAHQQIGQAVSRLGIRHLFCLGPATKSTIASAGFGDYFADQAALQTALSPFLTPHYCLLIKGSRSWELAKLVEKLLLQGK